MSRDHPVDQKYPEAALLLLTSTGFVIQGGQLALIGQSIMNKTSKDRDLADKLFCFVRDEYGLQVVLIPESLSTEDELTHLRGGTLTICPNPAIHDAPIFVCAHVFSHMAQLTATDKYLDLVNKIEEAEPPIRVVPEIIREYWLFEREAYRIGLSLLSAALGVSGVLKARYMAYMQTDMKLYFNYLLQGDEISRAAFSNQFEQCLRRLIRHPSHVQRFTPLPIPYFSELNRGLEISVK